MCHFVAVAYNPVTNTGVVSLHVLPHNDAGEGLVVGVASSSPTVAHVVAGLAGAGLHGAAAAVERFISKALGPETGVVGPSLGRVVGDGAVTAVEGK